MRLFFTSVPDLVASVELSDTLDFGRYQGAGNRSDIFWSSAKSPELRLVFRQSQASAEWAQLRLFLR
jgi:hypothetical protein